MTKIPKFIKQKVYYTKNKGVVEIDIDEMVDEFTARVEDMIAEVTISECPNCGKKSPSSKIEYLGDGDYMCKKCKNK